MLAILQRHRSESNSAQAGQSVRREESYVPCLLMELRQDGFRG